MTYDQSLTHAERAINDSCGPAVSNQPTDWELHTHGCIINDFTEGARYQAHNRKRPYEIDILQTGVYIAFTVHNPFPDDILERINKKGFDQINRINPFTLYIRLAHYADRATLLRRLDSATLPF